MIRSVSFCYRRASVTLLASWLYFMNEQFSLNLDFQSFSCSPDCNVFNSACTDNSSFRCSTSAYLMQKWLDFRMSCVLSPGHGAQRCSPVTSFPRILFLCINMSKNYSSIRFVKLSSNARLSMPERPTLQGMWTYLCVFRENLPKGTKKSVTEVRLELTHRWLGINLLYPLSYSASWGENI